MKSRVRLHACLRNKPESVPSRPHKERSKGPPFGASVVRQVDVLVIGAGPGGYPAAIRAAQLHKRVLLVERDKLGGECLNYGCIPSKALIHTANLVHAIERAAERGVETGAVKVDMARLQQWKGSVVQRLSNGVGQLCKGNGGDLLA